MSSVHNKIENKIKKSNPNKLFFTSDFSALGTAENIKKILLRIEKEGTLIRLAHGIYLKPKKDPVLGIIYPTIEEIARQIAQRDKARIVPTGVFALFLLGLTTQVPLKVSYLTDGSQREVKIGNNTIKFKRTVPKTFAIKNELLQLIVQAYKEIGQKNITQEFLKNIGPKVQLLPKTVLEKQLKYAPVWIQKSVTEIHHKHVD